MSDPYESNVALYCEFETWPPVDNKGSTVTANAYTSRSTSEFKCGTSSAYLNPSSGTVASIQYSRQAAQLIADYDFTLEFWIKPDISSDYSQGAYVIRRHQEITVSLRRDTSLGDWVFKVEAFPNDYSPETIGEIRYAGGQEWIHFAVCRASGVFYTFINGSGARRTWYWRNMATLFSPAFETIGVYLQGFFGTAPKAWIDQFRLTVGVARYIDPFTPSACLEAAAPPIEASASLELSTKLYSRAFGCGDPYYNYVTFLSHADSYTEASPGVFSWVDSKESRRLVNLGTAAVHSSSGGMFGSGCISFPGMPYSDNDDRVYVAYDGGLYLGGDDFCFEFWMKPSTLLASLYSELLELFCIDGQFRLLLKYDSGSQRYTIRAQIVTGAGNITIVSNEVLFSLGQWKHIALVREVNNFRIFIDGQPNSITTIPYTLPGYVPSQLTIGGITEDVHVKFNPFASGPGKKFSGQLDEIRLTKGHCRYTGSFSVPDRPYADNYSSTPCTTEYFTDSLEEAINTSSTGVIGILLALANSLAVNSDYNFNNCTLNNSLLQSVLIGDTSGIQVLSTVLEDINVSLFYNIRESLGISEDFKLGSNTVQQLVLSIQEELLNYDDTIASLIFKNIIIGEFFNLALGTSLSFETSLEERIAFASSIVCILLQELIGEIQLVAKFTDSIRFVELVEQILALNSKIRLTELQSLSEVMSVISSAINILLCTRIAAETPSVSSTVGINLATILVMAEGIDLNDVYPAGMSAGSRLYQYILDNISFIPSISFDREVYSSWVFNPEVFATTTYTGFDFNSYCKWKDKYYGASNTGLYQLTGTKDDDDFITAKVQTAALDFGKSNLKSVPNLYLGLVQDSRLILKVSVDGKATTYYRLNLKSNNLDTQRIKLGKGLVGTYFQFELITENNEQFDLEQIEFQPLVFTRKI